MESESEPSSWGKIDVPSKCQPKGYGKPILPNSR